MAIFGDYLVCRCGRADDLFLDYAVSQADQRLGYSESSGTDPAVLIYPGLPSGGDLAGAGTRQERTGGRANGVLCDRDGFFPDYTQVEDLAACRGERGLVYGNQYVLWL